MTQSKSSPILTFTLGNKLSFLNPFPLLSGSIILLAKECVQWSGGWITNWMTTPIWSHPLHRATSDWGGGKREKYPSRPPWYDWTHCVPREPVQRVRLWFVVFVRLQPFICLQPSSIFAGRQPGSGCLLVSSQSTPTSVSLKSGINSDYQ